MDDHFEENVDEIQYRNRTNLFLMQLFDVS